MFVDLSRKEIESILEAEWLEPKAPNREALDTWQTWLSTRKKLREKLRIADKLASEISKRPSENP